MAIRIEGAWVPCCERMTVGGMCDVHGRYGDQVAKVLKYESASGDAEALKETRPGQRFEVVSDLELERRALKACGYRVHEKERNGTRWLMACKGLQVQYKHWHPLTSIHQAMQLLIDCPTRLALYIDAQDVYCTSAEEMTVLAIDHACSKDAKHLIAAQCRAIVTACASLQP